MDTCWAPATFPLTRTHLKIEIGCLGHSEAVAQGLKKPGLSRRAGTQTRAPDAANHF